MTSPEVEDYAKIAAERFRRGRVVPFLGAGVNLADRPLGQQWTPGTDLPSGPELAEALARPYPYPPGEPATDLMRVSQFVETAVGETAIYDYFHEVFAGSFQPTVVHRVLARVPAILERDGRVAPRLLIVTTNYDDAQEQAFDAAGEEYDVVWYMAGGDHRGQFVRQRQGERPSLIDDPAKSSVSTARRHVILKIHGAALRTGHNFDSFVVTEDDYIEYMHATDLETAVPVHLKTVMIESHFLFLGYSLGDWNLRVFLHGLWAKREKSARSWAVSRAHRPLDAMFWRKRSVEMVQAPLATFMTTLETVLTGS